MLCTCRKMRHALHCRSAGTDHSDALIGQLIQAALGRAAGVVVVPAAGMESMAKSRIPGMPGSLGRFNGPLAGETKRARMTSAIGAHNKRSSSSKVQLLNPGLKQRAVIEVEVPADGAAGKNLGAWEYFPGM